MRTFVITLLLLIMSTSCTRDERLHPFRWKAAGGDFDSVLLLVEHRFNDYCPSDTIDSMINLLGRLAETPGDTILKRSRVHYYRARQLNRRGLEDSAMTELKAALALNDSVGHRYDYLRMKCLRSMIDKTLDGAEAYRTYDETFTYLHEIDDKAFEGLLGIVMGNLLSSVGEYDKAIYYMDIGDSLNHLNGFDKLVLKNKINRARIMEEKGDKGASDSILLSVIDNPAIVEDKGAHNVALRNLFVSSDEISWLRRAYAEIADDERFRHVRGLYNALFANRHFNEGRGDSTIIYAERAMADLPYVQNYDHRAIIFFSKSLACLAEERVDSAFFYRIEYEKYQDSAIMRRSSQDVLRLNALKELSSAESRHLQASYRRNMGGIAVVMALLLVGGVVFFVLNRRNTRQKIAAMKAQIALERARHRMTASEIVIEEKDNVLGALRDELSEMREEGKIGETNARRLESAIKAHLSEHESESASREMYDIVNPAFSRRLQERCGELADSYIRLACYILMGLDNKKIGRLMMIKPESVRQARWRLRQRLALGEGETLESVLHRLNRDLDDDV